MKKRSKINKTEKILYTAGISCFLLTVIVKIFMGASLGHTSLNVEKYRYELTLEERKIESLAMQINEKTSFDNVKMVVEEFGLSYNNNSILVINR